MTEKTEEFPLAGVENGCNGKPVGNAKPQPKLTFTLTPVFIIIMNENGWTLIQENSAKVVLECQNS